MTDSAPFYAFSAKKADFLLINPTKVAIIATKSETGENTSPETGEKK